MCSAAIVWCGHFGGVKSPTDPVGFGSWDLDAIGRVRQECAIMPSSSRRDRRIWGAFVRVESALPGVVSHTYTSDKRMVSTERAPNHREDATL